MKKIKKIMMTLTMVAFMFGLANIGSVKVQAASPSIDKSVTYNLYKGQVRFGSVWVRNPVTNAKITGLKNSNSKVIEVTASEDDMYPHVEIKLVGEGMILSILVDTFISKISFPMQPGPEIGSISDA